MADVMADLARFETATATALPKNLGPLPASGRHAVQPVPSMHSFGRFPLPPPTSMFLLAHRARCAGFHIHRWLTTSVVPLSNDDRLDLVDGLEVGIA